MSEPTSRSADSSIDPPAGAAAFTDFTGARRTAVRLMPPLSMLYLGLGVVQIFLAGYGVFDLNGAQLGSKGETAFGPHRFVGMLMTAAALLLLIAALVARPGRRLVIMAGSLLVVAAVLQSVLASLGEDTPLFGGLHALFGIGSLGLASSILAGTRVKRPVEVAAP
jgi:Family of unknown function (DUF6220)